MTVPRLRVRVALRNGPVEVVEALHLPSDARGTMAVGPTEDTVGIQANYDPAIARLVRDARRVGYLGDVRVPRARRGAGLGAAVVQRLAREGFARGADIVFLHAYGGEGRDEDLVRFYERLGFALVSDGPRGTVMAMARPSRANPRKDPRAFGRAFARYAASAASYEDVGLEGTWRAGGCWTMARGLARWIGPSASLWTVLGWTAEDPNAGETAPPPQHVVVRAGDLFFDGDGASSREALIDRWRDEEDVWVAGVEPFTLGLQRLATRHEMVCPARQAAALERSLARRFGDPRAWGL